MIVPFFERMISLITISRLTLIVSILLLCYAPSSTIPTLFAASDQQTVEEILAERMQLYESISLQSNIDWEWIAAIDQYERTLSKARPKARPQLGGISGIYIDEQKWAGSLNPDQTDEHPNSIQVFGGIGTDGNGDGIASRSDDIDLLSTLLHIVSANGTTDEDITIGLWTYYQNNRSVQRIQQFHQIYRQYGKLDLFEHAFPLPLQSTYSYRDTWGYSRGWGGKRIHEGTDLFAGYGVSVKSTCYGVVEIKGWNRYGGWRIGIRDLNNHYHYYAHLQGFKKDLKIGQIVEPGEVIGWVGSSGYGKPGTSGKFPPHLHYGIYSDRGYIEWAFDPYPSLKRWENEERKRLHR